MLKNMTNEFGLTLGIKMANEWIFPQVNKNHELQCLDILDSVHIKEPGQNNLAHSSSPWPLLDLGSSGDPERDEGNDKTLA